MTGRDRALLLERSETIGGAERPRLEIIDLTVTAAHGHGLAVDGLTLQVNSVRSSG